MHDGILFLVKPKALHYKMVEVVLISEYQTVTESPILVEWVARLDIECSLRETASSRAI